MPWKIKDRVDVYFIDWKGNIFKEGKGVIEEVANYEPDLYKVRVETDKGKVFSCIRTILYPDSSKITKEYFGPWNKKKE